MGPGVLTVREHKAADLTQHTNNRRVAVGVNKMLKFCTFHRKPPTIVERGAELLK